jgi:hypothetical protein
MVLEALMREDFTKAYKAVAERPQIMLALLDTVALPFRYSFPALRTQLDSSRTNSHGNADYSEPDVFQTKTFGDTGRDRSLMVREPTTMLTA